MGSVIELDMADVSPTIEVKLLGLRRFQWRLQIAFWMLDLTRLVAPFDLVYHKDVGEPVLLYCPFCGLRTSTSVIPGKMTSVECDHCGLQSVGHSTCGQFVFVHDQECDRHCEVEKGYGFVPEAGCPVHDP